MINVARRLVDSGVHLIDLTLGEDPLFYGEGNFDVLFQMVVGVKEETDTSVMVSPGLVPDDILRSFADLGVDWYALYQETYNRELFQKLRIGQDFEERKQKKETQHPNCRDRDQQSPFSYSGAQADKDRKGQKKVSR